MAKNTITLKRGDINETYFGYPIDSWESGSKLFFAAKPVPDNDINDTFAVINKEYGDNDIIAETHEFFDPNFKTYRCVILPSDTNGITFPDKTSQIKYAGEFQFIPPGGSPESFPKDNQYFEVVVYADIRRSIM